MKKGRANQRSMAENIDDAQLLCDCTAHIMRAEAWSSSIFKIDQDTREEYDLIDICVWETYDAEGNTLWNRVKRATAILFGRDWLHQGVMTNCKLARQFAKDLTELADKLDARLQKLDKVERGNE